VVIEILGAIAADAAGESMHKSKEKKKLEDTKDNPEEHARVLEEIEKRKERNNKMAGSLVGLFLLILSPALGIFFITLIMYLWPKTTGKKSDTIPDSDTRPETISPSERQALMSRKCSVPGCNTGNFRMTDYCHKHQDHIPSNSEPETEEEENWWEDEN
jgi:hypothetical protein